jgi:hypothetical protein
VSDIANFVIGGLMAGSALIGAGRKMLERRRARNELRSRPVLGTETDEGTVVRVTGVVRIADATLVSPIAGTECVMYRSRVMSEGGLVRRAFKSRESFAMVPFMLEREGEPAVAISGTHALLDLASVKLPKSRTADERSRREKFLNTHGLSTLSDGIFEEVIVEVGMRVSIAGLMMKELREPDADALYRDGPAVAPRLVGDATHPLVIGTPE